jgi:hypothetical protein
LSCEEGIYLQLSPDKVNAFLGFATCLRPPKTSPEDATYQVRIISLSDVEFIWICDDLGRTDKEPITEIDLPKQISVYLDLVLIRE